MLAPPDLSAELIKLCVYASFGLRISDVAFLPIGADALSAVYRVTAADGAPYLLKLRRGRLNAVAAAVPAFLHSRGIQHVMTPIAAPSGQLWLHAHGFAWMLYPFFEGQNGFEVALSPAQWRALGETMRAVHTTILPTALAEQLPREDYAPRWRTVVRAYAPHVEHSAFDDPLAARFAAFWLSKREQIDTMVERAEQLAETLQGRSLDWCVCHADLHGGNVLVGANDALTVVDWDEVMLAPKERDLMFVGAGIGGTWNTSHEDAWFYAGYGPAMIDPVALAYYRYERIVADLAAYGAQIFGAQGSVEDREAGLRQVMGQFLPNSVVAIAHQTYHW